MPCVIPDSIQYCLVGLWLMAVNHLPSDSQPLVTARGLDAILHLVHLQIGQENVIQNLRR
jgi:hypothetical protein